MRKILILNEHHFCYKFSITNIRQHVRFQMNIIVFLLNSHLHYTSLAYKIRVDLNMVDFAAYFTIYTIKSAFKNTTFYLESVVLEVIHIPIE